MAWLRAKFSDVAATSSVLVVPNKASYDLWLPLLNSFKMTLKKLDHQFKHEALSYDADPNYQPCVKLSFFFNKLPEVSYEQFYRHWETVHADLTVAAKDFAVCKIQRYVQFHQTPEMKEKAKSLGLVHMDFDGCSEIWVRTWNEWERFFNVS